jgi:hypothetical protein
MPNPDLVTGPDWTTALGSIAIGLTRGVGEGAEIIQRDRAQKMQQQRDAAEQAFRDRQMEREKARWDAEQAYRGRQEHIADVDRQGEALATLYQGNLPDTVPMENSGLPGVPEIPLNQYYSPEVISAAQRHVPKIRQIAVGLQEQKARGRNLEENTASQKALREMSEAEKAANISKTQETTAEKYLSGLGKNLFGRWPDEKTMEAGLHAEVAAGRLPAEEAGMARKAWYTEKVNQDNLRIQHPEKPVRSDLKTVPLGSSLYDPETGQWITPPDSSAPQDVPGAYGTPQSATAPRRSVSTVPEKDVPVSEVYGGNPPTPAEQPSAPKTLPTTALDGLDPKVRTLVLSALNGNMVAKATLHRQYPGVLEQVIAKRKRN